MTSDVFFISYGEPNADQNFARLLVHAPSAKRVNGVAGIFNAHVAAATLSVTPNFYVVDADAEIETGFDFSFTPSVDTMLWNDIPETECVFVWRSRNPVNDLLYGYGGVKLFSKQKLLDATSWNIDMTTTIGSPFVPKFQISNVTAFNTDPFNSWKSAFRECAKLSSSTIPNGDNTDNKYRLDIWCSRGANRPFGNECILGAKQGRDFGLRYKDNPQILNKINDFNWLRTIYDSHAT
jgi:hypothetical protein